MVSEVDQFLTLEIMLKCILSLEMCNIISRVSDYFNQSTRPSALRIGKSGFGTLHPASSSQASRSQATLCVRERSVTEHSLWVYVRSGCFHATAAEIWVVTEILQPTEKICITWLFTESLLSPGLH